MDGNQFGLDLFSTYKSPFWSPYIFYITSCKNLFIDLFQVIILWTANTERFCDVSEGLNDTAENLLMSIARNEEEVSPSSIFAVASILEKVKSGLLATSSFMTCLECTRCTVNSKFFEQCFNSEPQYTKPLHT